MIEMKQMQKLTCFVNAVLMVWVIAMTGVFAYFGVTYMVYHSIPTIALYVIYFYILRREKLSLYALLVYITITIYMMAATICLGYNSGFHLYCTSLIPLTFYMEYMGRKLNTKCINPIRMSLALVAAYLACTVFVVIHGARYETDSRFTCICLVVNAISVFCFLIGYANLMQKLVYASENKLTDIAHMDQLTGLHNRHYMLSHLNDLHQLDDSQRWIAMVDIDDFKHINDHYGHNGGDYVLVEVSRIIRDVCKGCDIARWGGEEFLIATCEEVRDDSILEDLRRAVEVAHLTYQGAPIAVTITVGVSHHQENRPLDGWIQDADNKMYAGKSGGKNQVVR